MSRRSMGGRDRCDTELDGKKEKEKETEMRRNTLQDLFLCQDNESGDQSFPFAGERWLTKVGTQGRPLSTCHDLHRAC